MIRGNNAMPRVNLCRMPFCLQQGRKAVALTLKKTQHWLKQFLCAVCKLGRQLLSPLDEAVDIPNLSSLITCVVYTA